MTLLLRSALEILEALQIGRALTSGCLPRDEQACKKGHVRGTDHDKLDGNGAGDQDGDEVQKRGDPEQDDKQRIAPRARERCAKRHRRLLPPIVVKHLKIASHAFDAYVEGEHALGGRREQEQRDERGTRHR
jgi:hypothetical protein